MNDFNQDLAEVTDTIVDARVVSVNKKRNVAIVRLIPKRKEGAEYVHVKIPADLYDSLCGTAGDFGIVKRGAWHILIRKLLRFAKANPSLFSSDTVL